MENQGCRRETRKEVCGCLEDKGQGGGLRAGGGWWKEDQRLVGSLTKVPLNGRTSLWCPFTVPHICHKTDVSCHLKQVSATISPTPGHTPNLF